ncbi:MAG: alpha/beta fold hydrolase [Ectothiorhodospiraceae bacterium]|nr:alpha/beta fold hydrolase [Ectothiorhodospiraceae bacterium]
MQRRLRLLIVRSLSSLFPGYFGAVAARTFLRPRRTMRHHRWASPFEGSTLAMIDLDEVRVPVWRKGSGSPVLLIHGWEQDHDALDGFVQPLLDASYSVVAFDLPAHGAATGEEAPLPLMARAITAVAESVGPLHGVVAHSVGGAMTVLAARHFGLQTGKAVLIGAPSGARAYALAQGSRQGLSRRALARMEAKISAALDEPLEHYRVDLSLQALDLDLLLIHAKNDSVVPFADATANATAGNTASMWLDDGGHNRLLGDAAVIRKAVAFLGGE